MEFLLIFSMLVLIFYVLVKARKEKNLLWLMMAIIACFSVGYYVLPVFFKTYSGLEKVKSNQLIQVLLMSLLFFGAIIVGVVNSKYILHRNKLSLSFVLFDKVFIKNYIKLFWLSFIIWLIYYFNADLTSYSSADFENYFEQRSAYAGILSRLAELSLSIMAVSTAISVNEKNKLRYLFLIIYVTTIVMLLVTGQRLSVITPIFMLVAAFYLYGNFNIGYKIMRIGIIFLILVSPLMVFVREFQGDRGKMKALEATKEFKSNDNYIGESLISIIQRADLLFVMTKLKEHYDDKKSFNHLQYFSSVLFSFVPKVIYPEKPYSLSDNGDMTGEASVEAWQVIVGKSTGSLSAFGSITAYREGGWIWVIVNGMLTGLMFTLVYYALAKGGHVSRILFVSIFVTISIKNVPLSFFYFIVYLVPTIHIIIFLKIFDKVLRVK